jgi:DNA-binding NtrC family response regulator
MSMGASILVVDDDEDLRETIARLLRIHRYDVEECDSGNLALERLENSDPDLVLMDIHMPGFTGIEVLEMLRARGDGRPVIIMSGAGTIELAVRATKLGALDFLEKPARTERLLVSVENALRFSRLHREHARLKQEAEGSSELLGESRPMAEVRSLIAKVSPSEGRVLILGENGTGKELAAAAIHSGSARKDGPFVKVNCGAIPPELIESELFGHERGAFTGAHQTRRGRFELAHGGTLFLDEVGDMPAAMQVKLLRVLQEGTLERVGGSRTLNVDVRVIAATNRDLAAMVQDKEFREDLYYRLNVVAIRMPPLRERRSDIPTLARSLLSRVVMRHGRSPLHIDHEALEELTHLEYPGNVRELGNIMERLMILAEGQTLTRTDVRRLFAERENTPTQPSSEVATAQRFVPGATYRELVVRAEREILVEAIQTFKGNKSAAARALGLERAHFAKKCRAVGLGDPGDTRDPEAP